MIKKENILVNHKRHLRIKIEKVIYQETLYGTTKQTGGNKSQWFLENRMKSVKWNGIYIRVKINDNIQSEENEF